MKSFKIQLMAATAATMLSATAAQAAGVVYQATDLQGNGASSIVVVLNKTLQCLGNPDAPIGFTDGTTQSFTPHIYAPVTPSLTNPNYDCATQSIQPNITAHYVSTGSGGGKTNWSLYNTAKITPTNPFTYGSHIQYAFSDSAISSTNLTDYTNNAAVNGTGPAIQIPFYVLPIALAYSPVYGRTDTGAGPVDLSFNVKSTYIVNDGAGLATGGLRMKKTTYCAIMNGTITNWNNAALTADNGGQSLRDPNDDLTRWNTDGVTIKLVGRSDNSGTTNLTSRHFAAVCPGTDFSAQAGGADQLPANRKGTATYDQQTGALTAGTETAGKFGLVKGSDGVASTVGQALATPAVGTTVLGGYFGYVGADFVAPATTGTSTPKLFSAALQSGTSTTTFKTPTAANATAAFGAAYLPPESATTGLYTPTVTTNGSRSNPLDWVLPTNATTKLANPALGYPIVGTTNLLFYTCYATPAARNAITLLANLQFGKVTKDSAGLAVPAALVNGTVLNASNRLIGVLAQNGISNLPSAWKTAIFETFFSKVITGNNPSSLNLWLQNKLPTTQAEITSNTIVQNSQCTAGVGA